MPRKIDFEPDLDNPFGSAYAITPDNRILAVQTPGHTPGHMSIILIEDGIHYFLAGDVTYDERALLDQRLQGPVDNVDYAHETLRRVKAYAEMYPTVYLPSHDPESAKRLAAKQTVQFEGSPVAFA
jgi:glyoxylase-like metal-dependent hydrolase (beta-lactamase superfamily II)